MKRGEYLIPVAQVWPIFWRAKMSSCLYHQRQAYCKKKPQIHDCASGMYLFVTLGKPHAQLSNFSSKPENVDEIIYVGEICWFLGNDLQLTRPENDLVFLSSTICPQVLILANSSGLLFFCCYFSVVAVSLAMGLNIDNHFTEVTGFIIWYVVLSGSFRIRNRSPAYSHQLVPVGLYSNSWSES